MNELTIFDRLTEDIRKRAIENDIRFNNAAGKVRDGLFEAGQALIDQKSCLPHGSWAAWISSKGINERSAQEWMRVTKEFSNARPGADLGFTVLRLLAQSTTPEDAKEEALERESLTKKQTKELIDAHKRIAELESKLEPDIDNIVPDLRRMLKGGTITEAAAKKYCLLDADGQRIVFNNLKDKSRLQNDLAILKNEKIRLLERESKANEKAETLENKFNEVVDTEIQKLLKEKDKEIQRKQTELEQTRVDLRSKLEKSLREQVELEYQDKIKNAEKAMDKAKRENELSKEVIKRKNEDAYSYQKRIKQLEDQLEVDNPKNIDMAKRKSLEHYFRTLKYELESLRSDSLRVNGAMPETMGLINEMYEFLGEYLNSNTGVIAINVTNRRA